VRGEERAKGDKGKTKQLKRRVEEAWGSTRDATMKGLHNRKGLHVHVWGRIERIACIRRAGE
jgi:hypothetical protein